MDPSADVLVFGRFLLKVSYFIKKRGWHENQSDGTRHKQKESTVYNRAWKQLEATRGGQGAPQRVLPRITRESLYFTEVAGFLGVRVRRYRVRTSTRHDRRNVCFLCCQFAKLLKSAMDPDFPYDTLRDFPYRCVLTSASVSRRKQVSAHIPFARFPGSSAVWIHNPRVSVHFRLGIFL